MRPLTFFKSLFLLPIFVSAGTKSFSDVTDGEKLYKATCAACHSIGKGVVVGPDLLDVQKRRPEEWLIKWTNNSADVIKSGDEYAVQLFEKFNKVPMPATGYTPDQVKSILAYIQTEGEKASIAKTANPAASSDTVEEDNSTSNFLILYGLLILFIILFFVLRGVVKNLSKVAAVKKGIPLPADVPLSKEIQTWLSSNKRLTALIVLLFLTWGSVKGWYWLLDIGVEQGYQPVQPINFSHKIHAGDNGIQCVYCHFGAEKSRNAGIPPTNVCMNCHKFIKEGPVTGTKEIEKIYAAVGWDVSKMDYSNKPDPVKWVKVHNLPDLAYFNHSQHVAVGKIACQTCHGPVQTMDVVRQENTLTMGWCIDCHRKTEVKMEGNPYYEKLHATLKERTGKDKFTVNDMGGTDCVRCHY